MIIKNKKEVIKIKYKLRDMLHHLKSENDWLLKNEPEKYEIADKECKENIYEAVKENIEFFSKHPKMFANQTVYFEISISSLDYKNMTLDDVLEIKEQFYQSVTGLYGRRFDNSNHLLLSDGYGRKFLFSVYKNKSSYDVNVYDMSGQRLLVQFNTKENILNKEQIKLLNNSHNVLTEQYEQEKQSINRYEQIKKYTEYIKIERIKNGYAQYEAKVTIKKDIPIELSEYEIAKYTDNWNYCFGGKISNVSKTEDEKIYYVIVYTD